MKKYGSIILGIILILVGVIFGLNALDITDIDIFFDGWWTLFIIIPCLIGVFNDQDVTGDIIGLGIGIVLFLACQDILSFEIIWKLMVPAILVIIGLVIIFKDVFQGKVKKEMSKVEKKDAQTYSATFGSQRLNFDNEEFKGCELSAVFGEVVCDLRGAKLSSDVVINVSCIFGGIDILVPNDIKVKVTSTPVFGGVDNKYINSKKEKAKTIYINATCVFGGVDIK